MTYRSYKEFESQLAELTEKVKGKDFCDITRSVTVENQPWTVSVSPAYFGPADFGKERTRAEQRAIYNRHKAEFNTVLDELIKSVDIVMESSKSLLEALTSKGLHKKILETIHGNTPDTDEDLMLREMVKTEVTELAKQLYHGQHLGGISLSGTLSGEKDFHISITDGLAMVKVGHIQGFFPVSNESEAKLASQKECAEFLGYAPSIAKVICEVVNHLREAKKAMRVV